MDKDLLLKKESVPMRKREESLVKCLNAPKEPIVDRVLSNDGKSSFVDIWELEVRVYSRSDPVIRKSKSLVFRFSCARGTPPTRKNSLEQRISHSLQILVIPLSSRTRWRQTLH